MPRSKQVMQVASDALVFFGATGDLAHKKIFPALQKLAKRGKLEIPVIGVAKSGWNLQQLQERAKNNNVLVLEVRRGNSILLIPLR